MHSIAIGHIKRGFPENISEMNTAQYRYFSFLELNRQMGKVSMAQLEVLFVYFALNMVRTSSSPRVIENVAKLRKLVQPYYTTQKNKGKTTTIVALNFLENPLPILQVNNNKLYGPGAALQNCTYEEVFVHAQNALLEFSNTLEEKHLDTLVATLYRPDGKRTQFNPDTLEDHLPAINRLLPEVKFGVYLFFASCQKFITNAKALDIGGGVKINIAQLFKPSPGQNSGAGIGPIGLIYAIAESGVFGNAKETASQGVYDILTRMVQLHEESKQVQENAKRRRA